MSRVIIHDHSNIHQGGKLSARTGSTSIGSGTTGTGGGSGSGTSAPTALDDLTDVTITTATAADRLRFDGALWVNSQLRWEPLFDPSGSAVLAGTLDPVMVELT